MLTMWVQMWQHIIQEKKIPKQLAVSSKGK